MAIETAAGGGPAASGKRRQRRGIGEPRGDHLVPLVGTARVSGEIHLAHARIHRSDHAALVRLLGEREQRGHRNHRPARGVRETLRHAAGDADAGKRTGPLAESERVHMAGRQVRALEHLADHRREQLGMPVFGERLLDKELGAAQQRHRAQLGRGLHGQEVHGAIIADAGSRIGLYLSCCNND